MTKKLSPKSDLPFQGEKSAFHYATNVMGDISKEDKSAKRALGLETTEEKINKIIQQSLSDPLKQAYEYVDNKSYAEIVYEEALKLTRMENPNHEDIILLLSQVIHLDPKKPWAHYERSLELYALGKYEEAALDATKEIELHSSKGPEVFYSYLQRAWANIKMNKVHLAAQDFQEYKKLDTGHVIDANSVKDLESVIDHHINKLHQKCRQDFKEFERFFSIGFVDFKEFEGLHSIETLGGEVSSEAGLVARYSDLLKSFDQLVESDPKRLWSRYDRGLALLKSCRYGEALLDFTKELEINHSKDCQKICRFEKGLIHYYKGDYKEAKSEWDKVLENQDESGDKIFEETRRNLKKIEEINRAYKEKTKEKTFGIPLIYFEIGALFTVLLAGSLIIKMRLEQEIGNQNRTGNSNHFREDAVAEAYTRNFARSVLDNVDYDESANCLVENFHKLPEDFFQRLFKSNTNNELREFLDEQQFLNTNIKNCLIENSEYLKKIEQDSLPKPTNYRFPKNFLRDILLKNSNSQNYPNDPVKMDKAIENFEDELSKNFHQICENILKNEKVKPLLDELSIRVEDLFDPKKNLITTTCDKIKEAPISKASNENLSTDDSKIPSTTLSPSSNQSAQVESKNNARKA
jgi:tetratricopeptide (TPR) repeat protein